MTLLDEYVGSAKVILDFTGKNDHQIAKIDKPKIRELNSTSFTPREFRLPDSVNNNMFYQYEILGTIYVFVDSDGLDLLVLQVDILDHTVIDDDTQINNLILDAADFYVAKEITLGSSIEIMGKETATAIVRGLNLK
jgi:hypothetical protein